MEEAIERLRAVPESQQEQLARFLLNELEEDSRWADSTTAHADVLRRLADDLLADDDRGLCPPLDSDTRGQPSCATCCGSKNHCGAS
jgi:hypothetical protein